MKFHKKRGGQVATVILMLILGIYWGAIVCINFAQNPTWYCTDMYSDMLYAVEVWNQKKIFPNGWVFGNQLYVVATPVFAALFYGLTQDPCVAMGIATTLMGLGVIISFYWMIKPFFVRLDERLMAVVCFMLVILLAGNPVGSTRGWQLFFTMCSYYACYAIAVFLAFGCYLRSDAKWTPGFFMLLAAACVFAFGTGVQSLRQTAIMTLPLAAVELMKILHGKMAKRKNAYRSTLIVTILSVFNLAGVVCSKFIEVEKNEIFGSVSLQMPPDLLEEIALSSKNLFNLFRSFREVGMILFLVVCISSAVVVIRKKNWAENPRFLCILLCIASVAVVWSVDIFTTMSIREIYYFLLYPMTAIGIAWGYSKLRAPQKAAAIMVVVLVFLSSGETLQKYIQPSVKNHPIQQVSDYLEENGITTIYSYWNFGERIAIASNFRIQAGFWDSPADVFIPVKYLCNPAVFDTDIAECAYVVRGEDIFGRASEEAQKRSVNLRLMNYFPELDVYVFTADQKLMQ